MKKNVSIISGMPITGISNLSNPIVGKISNIELEVDDILKCIIAKAKVKEIINDKISVPLDLSNYNKDNTPEEVVAPIEPIEPHEDKKDPVIVTHDINGSVTIPNNKKK